MQTLAQIRQLLDERGLAPRKSLGQNFLIDQNLIGKLIDSAGVGEGDLVLEVGPGTGTLTEALLERGCTTISCELDRGLAELLRDRLGANPLFTLIEGDCLESKHVVSPAIVEVIGDRPFLLVANLPYNAATPLITTLLIAHPLCRGIYVTIQKELAERICAAPGSKDYGPVAVVTTALATTKRIATLGPECFWPRPQVTSSMIAIERKGKPLTDDPEALAAMSKRLFANRRKQIGSVLGREVQLPAGIERTMRAEQLSPEQIISLAKGAHSA